MKAGWQSKKLGDVCVLLNRGISPKQLKSTNTVRPELVEGQKLVQKLTKGHGPSIHPSTRSGRTDGETLDEGNKL
ncbi:MAG: hypothetical protein PHC94_10660 [Methylobacter sp.]|nr:hypothetical protein [Methylobacter sp.]